MKLKSVFEQVAPQVFGMTNTNEAKEYIVEFIEGKNIKETDKQLIKNNLNGIKGIRGVHQYICNSLLKYEGMGVR
jgi:hypothetical protein